MSACFVVTFSPGKVKCGFHSCCGRSIRLLNNKMTASRSAGFNHGLVFSAKPLEEDEIFEVMFHFNFSRHQGEFVIDTVLSI